VTAGSAAAEGVGATLFLELCGSVSLIRHYLISGRKILCCSGVLQVAEVVSLFKKINNFVRKLCKTQF